MNESSSSIKNPDDRYKLIFLELLSNINDGSLAFVKQDNKVIQINVLEIVKSLDSQKEVLK